MSAPTAIATAPRARWTTFDAARLPVVVCVVWLHAVESPALLASAAIGRLVVPFFTLGAVVLLVESLRADPARAWGDYAVTRVRRLYLPFLGWTALYAALEDGLSWLRHVPPTVTARPALLFVGSAHHLWFLPWLLALSVGVFPLARSLARHPRAAWPTAALGALVGAALAALPPPAAASLATPGGYLLVHVWNALPSAAWGFAVAALLGVPRARAALRRGVVAAGGLLLALACVAWLAAFGRQTALENLAGVGALLAALTPWDGPRVRRAAALGPLAYGLYLAHVAVLMALAPLLSRAGLGTGPARDLIQFAGAALLGTATAWALRRHRATEWLAP